MKPPGPMRSAFLRGMARFYSHLPRRPVRFARRITPAGWLVYGVTVLTAFMGVDTNRTVLYRLFAILLPICVIGPLSTLFFRPRLRLVRHLPRHGTVGLPMNYTAEVKNRRRIRLRSVSLVDMPVEPIPPTEAFVHEREPGEEKRNLFDRLFVYYRWMWLVEEHRVAEPRPSEPIDVPARGSAIAHMHLVPRHRGRLVLHRVGALRPDVFGLFRALRRVREVEADELLVLPRRYPVGRLDLAGRSEYQPAGLALAASSGRSEEFVALRDYRPGDPIRHLHWKTWARTRRPVVKEYVDEYVPRYALVLDTFQSSDPNRLFEHAVSVAASFACELETEETLLELLFVGTEAYTVTSDRTRRQTQRLLEVLAEVDLCRDQPFSVLEDHVLARGRNLSACVLVLLDWDAPRQRLARSLQALGIPVKPLVLRPPGQAAGAYDIDVGCLREELMRL